LANSDDDTVLKALIDIAENAAKYLRPAIDEVFGLCLHVSQIQPIEIICIHSLWYRPSSKKTNLKNHVVI
jgi:hypothetical protein